MKVHGKRKSHLAGNLGARSSALWCALTISRMQIFKQKQRFGDANTMKIRKYAMDLKNT